jgi:hypothetical protein
MAAKRICLVEGTRQAGRVAATRARAMTTIVRKSFPSKRCYLLGELIRDSANRYYYRRHPGAKLCFVVYKSPSIHTTPCKACPDWRASHGDAQAAKYRTSGLR